MKENFGQYIRKLRNERNFTLTQLAARLGIDSGALSKIETGKRRLDEKLLTTFAEIFNLDEMNVRNEYYGDLIAEILFKNNCPEVVLTMAAEKVLYKRNKNIKQGNINF